MTDVAGVAGVSQKTVSRVINGEAFVSEQTRARVERAIEQLGYRMNPVARALASRQTGTVGIITDATALYGPSTQFLGLERAVWAAGHSVGVASLQGRSPEQFAVSVERLLTMGVDGLLVNGADSRAVASRDALPRGLPVVIVGDPPSADADADPGDYYAFHDQAEGARAVIAHLLALGHETVHHIAGPPDWLSALTRREAWESSLRLADRAVEPPEVGDWSAQSGYEAARRLLGRGGVTAIFAANDHMAIGALRAATEEGRDVPKDLSVVGFDDIPEAAYLPVPLTTVRQEFEELAVRAVGQLVSAIGGQTPPRLLSIPTALVVRASTAPRGVGTPTTRNHR